MVLKKRVAALAAATALTAAAVTAPAVSAQPAQPAQSAEPVAEMSWDAFYSLYDNPVTAPSALGSSLAIMAFGYLVYCPIAQLIGIEDPASGRCTI